VGEPVILIVLES